MSDLSRRHFLGILSALALAAALGGGCAAMSRAPSPPHRVWDESEVMCAGRWAG